MKKTNKQTNKQQQKQNIDFSFHLSLFSLYLLVQVVFYVFSSKGKKVEVEVAWTKVCVNLYGSSVCLGVASLGSVSCCVLSFA